MAVEGCWGKEPTEIQDENHNQFPFIRCCTRLPAFCGYEIRLADTKRQSNKLDDEKTNWTRLELGLRYLASTTSP